MDVTLALLADAANVSREGKLNLLGIFDTIFAPAFPSTHPQMQLVLRFEAEPAEAGSHRSVEVQFLTPEGQVLFRLPGTMTVHPRGPSDRIRMDQVVSLTNVQLERPGRYRFQVVIDGEPAAVVPLHVEQIAQPH
jgi:hypothetical protein